jgi:choline-glycine betaine transporter
MSSTLLQQALAALHHRIMDLFGWLYGACAAVMLALTLAVLFSPLARVKIGGPDARPVMSLWRWIATSITSTVAAGLFFWSAAEPIAHFAIPAPSSGVQPFSAEAGTTALAYMYLHWTFVPYAMYVVPALVFAIAHFNRSAPAGIFATCHGVLPGRITSNTFIRKAVECTGLVCLSLGIAASIGTGVLMLSRGTPGLFNTITLVMIAVCALVVMAGRNQGIGRLASVNGVIFCCLAVAVIVAGPTNWILTQSSIAARKFLATFPQTASGWGLNGDREWRQDWTLFYWTAWIAWAPVSALFLGGIARGRTVAAYLTVNFLIPSLFIGLWMSIFGSTVLHLQVNHGMPLAQEFQKSGPEGLVYLALKSLPWAGGVSVIFTALAFMSLVSLGSSSLASLAGMSAGDTKLARHRGTVLAWASVIGGIVIAVVNGNGIDGVRVLANLGAFPMLFLEILAGVALTRMLLRPSSARWENDDARDKVTVRDF